MKGRIGVRHGNTTVTRAPFFPTLNAGFSPSFFDFSPNSRFLKELRAISGVAGSEALRRPGANRAERDITGRVDLFGIHFGRRLPRQRCEFAVIDAPRSGREDGGMDWRRRLFWLISLTIIGALVWEVIRATTNYRH
jgi:hypothetical protein